MLLTREQVRHLEVITSRPSPKGWKISFQPIVRQMGRSCYWQPRIYGPFSGPLPLTEETAIEAGFSKEEHLEAVKVGEALKRAYPIIRPELLPELKTLGLPSPEGEVAEEVKPEVSEETKVQG